VYQYVQLFCRAWGGEKKKKRIKVNVIKKNDFFIVPPLFCDMILFLPIKHKGFKGIIT